MIYKFFFEYERHYRNASQFVTNLLQGVVTNCESQNKVTIYDDLALMKVLKLDFYTFLKVNISENYEFTKKKLRIARYGMYTSDYELAKLRIAKTTNCEVFLHVLFFL